MAKGKKTIIEIFKSTVKRLKKAKPCQNASYDDTINKLLDLKEEKENNYD